MVLTCILLTTPAQEVSEDADSAYGGDELYAPIGKAQCMPLEFLKPTLVILGQVIPAR